MVSYHKKSELKPLTESMKGYVAGIIDGEGSIVMSKCNRSRLGFNCWISVANTSSELIKWLIENIGGTTFNKNPKLEPLVFNGKICQRLPSYNWVLCATTEVTELLSQIIPFLIIKKDKAKKCLEITSQKLAIAEEEAKHYLINNPELQKELDRKQSRDYYQRHKEEIKIRTGKWKKDHLEENHSYCKKYYNKSKEKRREP